MNVMLNPGELMFDEDVNYVAEIQAWSSANSGNIPLHCFYPTSMQGTWYMPRHHMCIYGKAEQDTHFGCEVQIPGIDYHSSDTADQRIWPGWTHRDWRMNI